MEQQKSLDDAMSGVDDSPSTTKMAKVKQSNGKLGWDQCHGTTSLPLLHPPLAASNAICLHSASSASAPLQLQCILAQLVQLCHTHSQTNHRSILDLFRPGSHTKGCHLYTLSTFILFA